MTGIPPRPLLPFLRRLAGATGGNVALIFALALPPLAVATVGGVQLSYVVNVRSAAQDIADAAALAGAQQMSVSPYGAAERAKSWALSELNSRASSSTFRVSADAVDKTRLRVVIDAYTPSFFGDMLPKGGFRSHAESTAEQQAQAPLCVLIDGGASDKLEVSGSSRLTGSCLVHGNGDVQAGGAAAISATRVEAGGTASGPIAPTPLTGAPQVTDPFTALDLAFPSPCAPTHVKTTALALMLPTVHQEDVDVPNNTPIIMSPGEHYFCGKFTIGNNVVITGTDVVLIFDKDATFDPKPNATLSLSGRQSGKLSGFVLAVARGAPSFKLITDPFNKITGAIYAPDAQLELNGTKGAGAASDWTVVAAKALKVSGQANLQINTNYGGSQVTVPIGVGDKSGAGGAIRLVR